MIVNGSPDISTLTVKSTWDISGTTPQILLENLSTGADLASCSWWFVALAPGLIPIHEGSEAQPDVTGTWTDFTISDAWPRVMNNILWSGSPYELTVYVKDGDGNIFTAPVQYASICRPPGNKPTSTNTYGLATCLVEVKCSEARVFFQDTTNHTYKGLEGTIGSSVLRVVYPIDETGNLPAPFVIDHFSTALVPITYSSDNYQFQSSQVYDYDMGDYVHIRIRYQSFNPVNGAPAVRFAVLCNIDLCSLFCEVSKLVQDIDSGNCVNEQEAQAKLARINPLLWMIGMGIQQPLCGVDVPGLIEQVKIIGGFECNCCNAPTGIIPTSTSPIDGYIFSVVKECGDTDGEFVKTGNNIQLLLEGITYTFAFCDTSPAGTTAFRLDKTVDGCVAEVCLIVDMPQLAYDLANTITSNGDLLNLWQSIFNTANKGDFQLIVDGGCIFSSSATCNYDFTLSAIPVNTTYALLTSIKVAGVSQSLSYSFNLTNLAGLQAYLNALGLGTFTVTNPSGQIVLISTNANANDLQAITYKISGTTFIADFSRDCTGYVPISANQVVQNIINYLCALDDSEVVTKEEYTICYIDPGTGLPQTSVVEAGTELTTFFTELLSKGCQTNQYILSITPNTCVAMKNLFPVSDQVMQPNDYFFGVKNGSCARILPTEALLSMLTYGYYDNSVIEAFCKIVDLCRGGKICTQYSIFTAELITYDEDCPQIISVVASAGTTGIDVTNVVWGNTPTSSQSVRVEYYDTIDFIWILVDASATVNEDGVFTPTINAVTGPGVYQIRVSNTCESPPIYAYSPDITSQG